MEDTYNFDEIRCLESYSFANLANDMGYFDVIFLLGDDYSKSTKIAYLIRNFPIGGIFLDQIIPFLKKKP